MKKDFIIIDGNSLINRAYFALQRPMITKEGIYTQGIYGFMNIINRILIDYNPKYMAVAWDLNKPTFRHLEYTEYKAGRNKMPMELAMQMPLIKEVLDAMNIRNLQLEGYEADDIIGTLARLSEEKSIDTLIITGDRDALQLVDKNTQVLITKKGISEFELYDEEKMKEKYSLTPRQFIDLKGLMGDKSDNIPGIPGVGEVTGINLLKEFGSIDNLLENYESISKEKLREKVKENINNIVMSKKLATINKEIPLNVSIEELTLKEPSKNDLYEIFTKLEFHSMFSKFGLDEGVKTEEKPLNLSKLIEVNENSEIEKLNTMDKGNRVYIKVLSDNSHLKKPEIFFIAINIEDKTYYADTREKAETVLNILINKKAKLYGCDLINDIYPLLYYGLKEFEIGYDISIGEYLINPSKKDYSISKISMDRLGTFFETDKKMTKEIWKENLTKYFALVKAIEEKQLNELEGEKTRDLLFNVELPLVKVLAFIEYEGFAIDKKILFNIGENLQSKIKGTEKKIYSLSGEEFNINSPSQLGVILFEKLELPFGKKTKRGYSTSADILEKISDIHPIVPLVLEYRMLTKLNSTYIVGLTNLIGFDGRIRPHFMQTVASTGRLSCTEPNLQNIPIRTDVGREIRKAFISEVLAGENKSSKEKILIGADYSQIELRVLAHLSHEENLINSFNLGEDIHKMTAAKVLGVDEDKVTPLDRSRAKAVNFGVIYGMSGFGLSEELGITRKAAEKYIKDYFEKYTSVKEYMDREIENCRLNGYTETIFGRKRYVPEIKASNFMVRQGAERLAMNTPIQGSAADIIKIAMLRVFETLRKEAPEAKLILQIHDELIIECDKKEELKVKEILKDSMINAADLEVKLDVNIESGHSWFELK